MNRKITGINHQVGQSPDPGKSFSFRANAFEQRFVLGQWVNAASLTISPRQNLCRSIDENNLGIGVKVPDFAEELSEPLQRFHEPNIDNDR